MTPPLLPHHPTNVEMTADARFGRRVRRLVGISATALGVITLLAMPYEVAYAPALLAMGWLTMPTLLLASLWFPGLRKLLVVPAGLFTAGLVWFVVNVEATAVQIAGWWLVTVGIVWGGTLGAWLWYRWFPVPAALDEPFSSGRWTLVGLHAGLVIAGLILVLGAAEI